MSNAWFLAFDTCTRFVDKVIYIFCHYLSVINSTVLPLLRCPILTCSSAYTNGLNLKSSNCFL